MRNVRWFHQYKKVYALLTALVGFLRSNVFDFMYTVWIWHDTVLLRKKEKEETSQFIFPYSTLFLQSRQSTEQLSKAALEVCELQLLRFFCLGSWHSTSHHSATTFHSLLRTFQLEFSLNEYKTYSHSWNCARFVFIVSYTSGKWIIHLVHFAIIRVQTICLSNKFRSYVCVIDEFKWLILLWIHVAHQ